jgi:Flp pilus assembly protein TadD
MSLLLDALKKSGDQPAKTGLSLEEPVGRAASAASSSPASPAATRAAGETLFSAKKKKTSGPRWKLGLVPTTFLICSVIGAGYGYYVWLELQPPKQPVIAAVPPAPPPVPAPVAIAPLVPLIPPAEEPVAPKSATTPAKVEQKQVAESGDDFDAPRKPRAAKPRNRTSAVAIQRNLEADGVMPALIEAWQAYQRGDYVAAAQGYRQVLTKDPNNRDALLGMAATAQQQGMDEAAQRYYRQLLVLDPRDPAAHAALQAYSVEDTANSESRLKQLLAEQPRSGALHFALGNLYADQSNWADAQQQYFDAYALEPTNAQYAYNLAVSLDHLGQGKLAAQHYRQALQLDASGNSGFNHAQAEQRLNELTTAK